MDVVIQYWICVGNVTSNRDILLNMYVIDRFKSILYISEEISNNFHHSNWKLLGFIDIHMYVCMYVC